MENKDYKKLYNELLLKHKRMQGNGLKLEDWDKLKEDDILILNHDNGSFKCGDKFRFQWSDGISIVVKPDGDESSRGSNNIYLDRASILFFHTIEQWEN
jgi:hypothetical protein